MADKYLKHNGAGNLEEVEAASVGGTPSADQIPALDANGRLAESMMPSGIGADTATLEASETLAGGAFINVWNDGGTAKIRNADATTVGREAHGFVKDPVTSGANGEVYFEGNNDAVSGATPGIAYLSTTAGGFQSTPPTASGNVVQRLGFSTAATNVNFDGKASVVLA